MSKGKSTKEQTTPGIPVSSTNKTPRHDITEILLRVALNTINQAKPSYILGGLTLSVFTIFRSDFWKRRES
jgi:hypothetical protein